jgi:hypothetical protein
VENLFQPGSFRDWTFFVEIALQYKIAKLTMCKT